MCGRYVLVQNIETIEKRFNVKSPEGYSWSPSYNISLGQMAPVITSEHPNFLDLMQFGMTPHWAKKQMYLFNARAEGDRNKENNPDFSGAKDIINKPAFRKSIRSQRCLIIADAFIEGTTKEGLSKPHLVYLQNKERPFAMAGIFDEWKNIQTGESVRSFAIITTTANGLMQKIPHQRMPVILKRGQEQRWLNLKTPLADITKLLHSYEAELMNAYPITPEVKSSKAEGKHLIDPQGERLNPEYNMQSSNEIHLHGMGRYKQA
jgi:putative SOS response-associated peptidase YedK